MAELTCQWLVKRGEVTSTPPFSVPAGCNDAEIWMMQESRYTDEYGNTATAAPKATVNIKVAADTVWATNADELGAFALLGADDAPDGKGATQRFGSPLQAVTLDWHYESAVATIGDAEVTMPHYELQAAQLTSLDVREGETKSVGNREVTLYDITATFTQKAVAKGLTEASAPTIPAEVEVEYIVNYIGAIEITLVKVEYIPSGQWIDPHDNLPLAFYAKVERYRTYSNGKRIGPDEFYDYGHPTQAMSYSNGYNEYEVDGEWIKSYPRTIVNIGDSIYNETRSHQVSNLGTLWYDVHDDEFEYGKVPFDWSYYTLSYPYEDNSFELEVDLKNDKYESVSLPSGWYWGYFVNSKQVAIHWEMETFSRQIFLQKYMFGFHDQFLVIDGKRIDFRELHGYDLKYDYKDIPFSDATKEGHIFKMTVDAKYLGKNFHAEQIDSVFVVH